MIVQEEKDNNYDSDAMIVKIPSEEKYIDEKM